MEQAKGKRIFRTVYIILTIIWWIRLFVKIYISELTAVHVDDHWGYLALYFAGFVFFIVLLTQLGIYRSMAYLIFEPQQKPWKFVVYLVILAISLITFAQCSLLFI